MISHWMAMSNTTQLMLAAILGLIIGSFLNVVIARLPALLAFRWQQASDPQAMVNEPAPPNLVRPRSHCPTCKATIAWYDNLPLISWLWLRGHCRHCQTRISMRYPLIELTTALVFVSVAWTLGPQPPTLAAWILSAYLVAAAAIDFEHQLLPDSLTMGILWLGLLVNATFGWFASPSEAIWGAVAGYAFFWLVFQAFYHLTGKEGLGFGDFKLLAGLGAWLGLTLLPLVVFIGSFTGTLVGLFLMIRDGTHKDTPLAFGPYLALGGWIALLWGQDIIDWVFPYF